jgi:integrase
VVDLIGKGGHIRTVPIPEWVKAALDQWTVAARVTEGRIFRAVARAGKIWGKGVSQNVVWYVVKTCCERMGLEHIAPHDLRRTCAKLCHDRGGELESRFNSCWDMHPCRRRNNISAASKISDTQ